VTIDGLTNGTDYTAAYANNVNAGTATVTITGKGNYTGKLTASFQITIAKDSTYTVSGLKVRVTKADTDGKGTVTVTGAAQKTAASVSVPATVTIGGVKFRVTAIGASAFKGYTKLKKVKMDKGVTSIGDQAFNGCSALTSLTIGADVTTIGASAFASCKKLASVAIPSKVTTIGSKAFSGCAKLKTVTIKSTKLKKVGSGAFKSIAKTARIKVPAAKLAAYRKLLKGKGQSSGVKITK
jgi:hypothetical protein